MSEPPMTPSMMPSYYDPGDIKIEPQSRTRVVRPRIRIIRVRGWIVRSWVIIVLRRGILGRDADIARGAQ